MTLFRFKALYSPKSVKTLKSFRRLTARLLYPRSIIHSKSSNFFKTLCHMIVVIVIIILDRIRKFPPRVKELQSRAQPLPLSVSIYSAEYFCFTPSQLLHGQIKGGSTLCQQARLSKSAFWIGRGKNFQVLSSLAYPIAY
jgi:hypothetical protein